MECPHCHRQVSSRATNCKACGGHIPSGQYLLEEAGIEESTRGTAAPAVSEVQRNAASANMARLHDRFAAFLLDMAALFGVFAVVDAWILLHWGRIEGAELNLTAASLLMAGASNAVILFAYGWLLEASFGATLGKMLLGIRVVRSGRRSALAAAAIRNAMRIVDGFGIYAMGALVASCSRCRQRLGDLCAGTAVVEAHFGKMSKAAAFTAWVAMLAGAVWAMPRICARDHEAGSTRYLNQVVVSVGRTGNSAYLKIAGMKFDVEFADERELSRR